MNVNIQSVHFEADSKLVEYVEKKLAKLFFFPICVWILSVSTVCRRCLLSKNCLRGGALYPITPRRCLRTVFYSCLI